MKKLFLFFVLICFLFVGCKTTKNAGETLPPESQAETTDQVEIEPVPPVEESFETEPSLEEVIENQGDLPLPFDQEFETETDEFTSEDEFYYGDDFVPENQEENQIPENTEVEIENEPELIISDEFFTDEEFNSEDEFLSEEEFLENQLDEFENELNNEVEELESDISENLDEVLSTEIQNEFVPENENQFSETLTEESSSLSQNNENNKSEFAQSTNLKNENEVVTENKNTNTTENTQKEVVKNPQPNVEPITRKEIEEIVEDILSKNETSQSSLNPTEISEETGEKFLPSRTVYATKNQTILVSYPGNNWVYLGELESQSIVGFKGKTFADNLTTFKISPQKEGRTLLHFYKVDAISGKFIDDYLEVVISPSEETAVAQSTVNAPEYTYDMYLLDNKNSLPVVEDNSPIIEVISSNNENNSNPKNTDKGKSDIKPTESTIVNKELAETEVVEEEPELLFLSDIFDDEKTENSDSQPNDDILFDTDLLDKAKTAYNNKDYENALSLVNKFLESSIVSIDEALFLKGQILEKPFANRNIRDALDCYKKIISTYPQSDLWDKADERIKYIQRFYFNIR